MLVPVDSELMAAVAGRLETRGDKDLADLLTEAVVYFQLHNEGMCIADYWGPA